MKHGRNRGKSTDYKPSVDSNGRVAFTVRVTPQVYERLLQLALENERSLGAEVSVRLTKSVMG